MAPPLLAAAVFTPLLMGTRPAPAAPATAAPADPAPVDPAQVAEGRELFLTGCSSCHGPDGEGEQAPDGSLRGPPLQDVGTASAFYFLSTGRMPLANPEEQPTRKPRAYSPEQVEALVAFVSTLGPGPPLPDIDLRGADVPAGGVIFRQNCQACHSASGSGGALSYGRAAPRLAPATPREIGAAVRSGPGQMPVFGPETITPRQLDDLVAYVQFLDHPTDRGGLPIGRTGPIPEGFVAWLVGMVVLLIVVGWIGTRDPLRRRRT